MIYIIVKAILISSHKVLHESLPCGALPNKLTLRYRFLPYNKYAFKTMP